MSSGRRGATPEEGEFVEIIGSDFAGDSREPHGVCRWCGADNTGRPRAGLALIRLLGEEWYECGSCAWVIAYELALDTSDPEEIRHRSALARAEEPWREE